MTYSYLYYIHIIQPYLDLQDGAPKIAKLVYKWFNIGLW